MKTQHIAEVYGGLKAAEQMAELLYQEIQRLKNGNGVVDEAFESMRAASLLAIDVKRKIQDARGWQAQGLHKNEANGG